MNKIEQNRKEERLYQEIKTLLSKIKDNTHLQPEERKDVIADTLLKLLGKEKEGHLSLDDYDTYKGYLFITTRNFLYRYLNKRKNQNQLIYSNTEDLTDDLLIIHPSTLMDIKNALNRLKDGEKEIIYHLIDGTSQRTIAKTYNVNEKTINLNVKEIRMKLKRFLLG